MVEPAPAAAPRGLIRGLGLVPAAALIVTNVIGTGVFVKARVMTCNAGTPGKVLLAYVVGGALTLAGALTFAELGSMMPRAGGQYVYLDAAFGRLWAFLFGWIETLIDGAAGTAAVAIVFVVFWNDLVGGAFPPGIAPLLASGILLAVTFLSLASVRANGALATVVTVLKVLLVAGIGVAAFAWGDGGWANFAASASGAGCDDVPASARLGLAGFGTAIVGALWSYNGWSVVSLVAEEVRSPARSLPRALVGASALIIALYLLVNAGYFWVLGPAAVAAVPDGASVAGRLLVRLVGAGGAALMSAGLMLSTFGTLHSGLLATSRVPFAMARDGLLPRPLAEVSSRTGAPGWAVLTLGLASVAFTWSGTFDVLTDMVVFVLLFFNGLAVAAVYVLRRTRPGAPRPYRVWGYPWVPALYLLATAYLMINTLIATPGRALAGIGIIALGLPVYAHYARRSPRSGRNPGDHGPSVPDREIEPG